MLQRHVLNMNETPLEWDELSKEEVPFFTPPLSYPRKLTACTDYPQFAATRPTVLMFHGNGGNHGHRIPLAKIFFGKMRCNVLMLSYRGHVLLALLDLPPLLTLRSLPLQLWPL